MEHLEELGIEVLDWAAISPDLNPIENYWAYLSQRIEKRIPQSQEDLANMIQRAYEEIPADYVRKLTNSFRRRLQECVRRRGDATPY